MKNYLGLFSDFTRTLPLSRTISLSLIQTLKAEPNITALGHVHAIQVPLAYESQDFNQHVDSSSLSLNDLGGHGYSIFPPVRRKFEDDNEFYQVYIV